MGYLILFLFTLPINSDPYLIDGGEVVDIKYEMPERFVTLTFMPHRPGFQEGFIYRMETYTITMRSGGVLKTYKFYDAYNMWACRRILIGDKAYLFWNKRWPRKVLIPQFLRT